MIHDNIDPELNYVIQDPSCSYYNCDDMAKCFVSRNSFKVICFNMRSVNGKLDLLLSTLISTNTKFSLIVLTETWLNNVNDFEGIPGYNAHHCVREGRVGGGVSVFVDDSIKSSLVDVHMSDVWESVCVRVVSGRNSFGFVGVYRPPNPTLHNFNDLFFSYIDTHLIGSSCFVVGDLNVDICGGSLSQLTDDFLNNFRSRHYFPLINIPTRITDHTSSCIDHIWANSVHSHKCGVLRSDLSDHYGITFDIDGGNCVRCEQITKVKFRDVSPSNIEKLANELQLIFSNFIVNSSFVNIDDACNLFLNLLYITYNKVCPIKTRNINMNKSLCPWINSDVLEMIKQKNALFRLSRSNPGFINEYKATRNQLSALLRKTKASYYNRKFDSCSGDSKTTWKLINGIVKPTSGVVKKQLGIEINGNIISEPAPLASAFNDYFVNMGITLANEVHTVNIDPLSYVNRINSSFVFTPTDANEIRSIILSFKSKQCCLTDVPNYIFKLAVDTLAPIIAYLINRSLDEGCFPSCLKNAIVVPIFKKGSVKSISNYRPISTLCFLSKIFERAIHNRLMSFFNKFNVIVPHQYGFRPGKSTCDSLIKFTDNVYSSLNDRKDLIAVFLDLRRAFDTVHHGILLRKLESCGIRGSALEWFRSYLTDRTQAVRVDNHVSPQLRVTTGVPQGSILGPTLFNVYINDMSSSTNLLSFVHYADDTTVFRSGESLATLTAEMTSELSSLDIWLRANILSLNLEKTKMMVFTNKRENFVPDVRINNTVISVVDRIDLLGVIIDNKLSFVEHCTHILKKISRTIGVMRRVSYFVPVRILRQIYFSLLYPYLTYCIELWGKSSKVMNGKLERVQVRCVGAMVSDSSVDGNTFRKLNLFTLSQIYHFCILCRFYRYYRLKTCNYFYVCFTNLLSRHDFNTRFSLVQNFNTPQIILSKYFSSFKYNALKLWNILPDPLRSSTSLLHFKHDLRIILLSAS